MFDRAAIWKNLSPWTFPGRFAILVMAYTCGSVPSQAADLQSDARNKGIVQLETGGSAGASIRIAEDLAGLVDDGATRRVLPVVGKTAQQSLWDLILLRGVDMAILQADVLESVRQKRSMPGLDGGFTYIAKLYNEEFHLLAGPGVKTVADLAHQRVDVGPRGSGTSVTAERLFDLLKIPVEPTNDRPELALEKLRRGGIAAMAFVGGKPASLFQELQSGEHLHFIPIPLDVGVINAYVPTTLSADDYPKLISNNQSIDTVSVGSLLAVANLQPGSERYRNVSNFVDVFFTEFRSLLEPGHHPKWHEINLSAGIAGLTRFPPAQQWLDRNVVAGKQNPQDVKALFARFLDTRQKVLGGTSITDGEKEELFNQFQLWQAGQGR